MVDVWNFVQAVAHHWVVLVGGGLVMVGLGVYERFRNKPIRWRRYLWVLAGLVLAASFLAWKDEHAAYKAAQGAKVSAERKLEEQWKPRLTATLEHINAGHRETNKNDAEVFFLVTVRNEGAPSIVENYRMHLRSPRFDLEEFATAFPADFEIYDEGGKLITILHPQEALYEKTDRPIQRGDRARGWLRFTFKGVPLGELTAKGASYTLSFQDISGKTWAYTYDMTGIPGRLMYYPGTDQPVLPRAHPPSDP